MLVCECQLTKTESRRVCVGKAEPPLNPATIHHPPPTSKHPPFVQRQSHCSVYDLGETLPDDGIIRLEVDLGTRGLPLLEESILRLSDQTINITLCLYYLH